MNYQIPTCALFQGITQQELSLLLSCMGARQRTYQKDEFIFGDTEILQEFGVVLEGSVHVIREDFWGNRTIVAQCSPGELFGEAFAWSGLAASVSALAAKESRILFLDAMRLSSPCQSSCGFHTRLIGNMMGILAAKNMMLTQKLTHMAQRTTREKLISYLSQQAQQAGKDAFYIPFDRQQLADFLAVERSAMSRELGSMKRDGLIDYSKNRFVLKRLDR